MDHPTVYLRQLKASIIQKKRKKENKKESDREKESKNNQFDQVFLFYLF
jgi:hypothetical protein